MWDNEYGPALRQKSFNIEVKCGLYCKSKTNKFSKVKQTRKHSSRMRTFRLETIRAPVSVATTRRHSRDEGLQVNKFEQVSSDHYQMSPAGVPQVWCPGEGRGVPYLTFPGGVPYHGTYLMMHLMLSTPPPPRGQTHTHLWKHYLPTT